MYFLKKSVIKIGESFVAHPNLCHMTYIHHFLFAYTLVLYSLIAGFALIIHVLLPFLFETTGSRYLKKAVLMIEDREKEIEAKKNGKPYHFQYLSNESRTMINGNQPKSL